MIRAIIYVVVLLTASCARQSITTTNTYEKAMPFSKAEIKKVEANQEAACAEYSTKSNIRIKWVEKIHASMNEPGLTQKQKNERYDYLMAHINDGLEEAERLKDKCDALNKMLDEMYKANHIAGDQYLDQQRRN